MNEKHYWLDQPKNIKLILRILYVICAGLLVAELIIHRHAIHSWEDLFGFYALYGFIGCVVLVLVAKEMRKLVMRKEDYYEQKRGDGE
jgi:hypothetical protein